MVVEVCVSSSDMLLKKSGKWRFKESRCLAHGEVGERKSTSPTWHEARRLIVGTCCESL